jgi:hypothetical protein
MEALLAFYFGWSMGARSGPEGVNEINSALVSLRESEEFNALLGTLRKHAASILRDIASRVESNGESPLGMPDMLARIYDLVSPAAPGTPPAPGTAQS